MTLIIGGSGSGKSSYAEQYVKEYAAESQKYYLATMQVFDGDQEGRAKVARHRQLRRGKGFVTIEQPRDIDCALDKMISGVQKTALLECISNLTANEMFLGEHCRSAEQVSVKVIGEVRRLNQGVAHLVVVSNNVFEDGIAYDETTMEYIRAMGAVNQKLAAMADRVVEVVVGIHIVLKA